MQPGAAGWFIPPPAPQVFGHSQTMSLPRRRVVGAAAP